MKARDEERRAEEEEEEEERGREEVCCTGEVLKRSHCFSLPDLFRD
jgi:hypothetical protein